METASRRQKLENPSILNRLRRLPAEGYFLLLASFPLAAIIFCKVTLPLFGGEYGSSPVQVIQNFVKSFTALDARLSACPSVLSPQVEQFFVFNDVEQLPHLEWQEIKLFNDQMKKEPLKIVSGRKHTNTQSCADSIQSLDIKQISHWVTKKSIQFKDISSKFEEATEYSCTGGVFAFSQEHFKGILQNLFKEASSKVKRMDLMNENPKLTKGFIGTAGSHVQLGPVCGAQLILQICGTSQVLLRYPLIDGATYAWSNVKKGSLHEGDILLLPTLSIAKIKVESKVVVSAIPNTVLDTDLTSTEETLHKHDIKLEEQFITDIENIFEFKDVKGLIAACIK